MKNAKAQRTQSVKHLYEAYAAFKAQPDTGGGGTWFQTTPPYGEYDITGIIKRADGKKGAKAKMIYDARAAELMLAAFKRDVSAADGAGILVDREHNILKRDSVTDAMAWAKDIRRDADGSLWTRWEFTPPGKDAWENKVLVKRSPVLEFEKISDDGREYVVRPSRITSITMTNTPFFKELSTLAAAKAGNPKGEETMQKLLTLLGLADTATEDEAAAALEALIAERDGLKDAQDAAAIAAAKARCDAFVEKHKGQIADEAAFRAAYEADPDNAERMFGAFKAVTPLPAVKKVDTAAAKTPPGNFSASCAVRRQEALNNYRRANPFADYATAWAACKAVNPDWFND